jgi:phosphate-selective porin OprO and OprP
MADSGQAFGMADSPRQLRQRRLQRWVGQGALFVLTILLPPERLRADPGRSAESQTAAPTVSDAADEGPNAFSEKFQFRVRTNSPASTQTPGDGTKAGAVTVKWDFSWKGWDGLAMGVSKQIPLRTPRELLGLTSTNAPIFHLEQLKLSASFNGLLEVDGAAYATTSGFDLPNDIQLRRGRLRASGDCILILPVTYEIEVGYIPNQFNLNKAWIASEHIDYIGNLKAGVFAPPMGLDMLTSSRDLAFMEPATVLQALAPANEGGLQIGQPVFDRRATWALGLFGGGLLASEYGNASQDYGNVMGRMTFLAIDHLDLENPHQNRLLHLGLSANVQYSASSSVRYRSRPESYVAGFVVDTGNIDANGSATLGAEAAYVNGPFSIQGEFLDSLVNQKDVGGLNFFGFYACASWYLTGESRPYDRGRGIFKRLIPRRNFNFGRGGAWGAFEVAARFSYTDLSDRDVHGGRINLLMGELNWYLHSHVRWMFNVGGGQVNGGATDGRLFIAQTRIGVDF